MKVTSMSVEFLWPSMRMAKLPPWIFWNNVLVKSYHGGRGGNSLVKCSLHKYEGLSFDHQTHVVIDQRICVHIHIHTHVYMYIHTYMHIHMYIHTHKKMFLSFCHLSCNMYARKTYLHLTHVSWHVTHTVE